MKTPLAFISYDHTQGDSERERFINEISTSAVAFNVDDWSVKPMSPREEWEKVVHSRIGRCDFLIVFVAPGADTTQIALEILEAKRCNVPFFGVRVGPGAVKASELPSGLASNRVIPWDWAGIANAIVQVTKEGKHHVFA